MFYAGRLRAGTCHGVSSKTQAAAAAVNTQLRHADWPKSEWWKDFNDPQLNALIDKALADAPDMQIARQRITGGSTGESRCRC